VIRRFSGGGTVIVDTDTVFVTLICRRDAVTLPDLYPRPIMEWTEHLYLPAFQTVPRFHLQEHENLEAMLNQLSKTGFFIIHHSYGTIRTSGWHT
jgi:lipoate-protein ligase A